MKPMGLNEIREKYLAFFERKGHLRLKSFPLIPQNDKSLLLINSGMAPLKPYFSGQQIPPCKRVTTCQKCIRTNDIENTGKDARHGSFFEMLGNFSFGDYFKEEIIPWAWEFITKEMEISEERLYVSVFEEDDEAYNIWHKKIGLPEDKIFRLGKEDNFWEVGFGPCGPDSEIHYDRGEQYGCGKPDCRVGCDCDRFMEIWNLVFTQFNKNEDGSYTSLDNKNIDTGMGLERIAMVMQDVPSIFDVDTIVAIRKEVCRISGTEYGTDAKKDCSIRIITDHIRSVSFMLTDGVLPSNEGRGYVLRRLLRRAARHGKILGISSVFMTKLAKIVIANSKDAYPELVEKQEYIFKILGVEENRFYETLDQGMEILKTQINLLKKKNALELAGSEAFKLYDTYGFPLEFMQEILEEEGLRLDEETFRFEMEQQRNRGRSAREESTYMGADATVYDELPPELSTSFTGYMNDFEKDAVISAIIVDNMIKNVAAERQSVSIVTDKTPLYAESGGQVGDKGTIVTETGEMAVSDCIKVHGNKFVHIGTVKSGEISIDQKAEIKLDNNNRMDIARNHSATHLLQKTLREILGSHIEQAGSHVSSDRLRFDFTHFEAIPKEILQQIEDKVNEVVLNGFDISVKQTSMEEARKMGAMALFGEKYSDTVRVVNMGGYSVELCGGTHLTNTAQIGAFKILSESGVAAGVRRIEALTGRNTISYYKVVEQRLNSVSALVKSSPDGLLKKIESVMLQTREMSKTIEKLQAQMSGNIIDDLLTGSKSINGFQIVSACLNNIDMNGMRAMSDQIKDRIKSGVVILAGGKEGKYSLIVTATDDTVKAGVNCGAIVKEAAAAMGGSGGGKPNMAQAGIKDASKINDGLEKAKQAVADLLNK